MRKITLTAAEWDEARKGAPFSIWRVKLDKIPVFDVGDVVTVMGSGGAQLRVIWVRVADDESDVNRLHWVYLFEALGPLPARKGKKAK